MFRFHKTLDVITLFHKAQAPASLRVHTLLKQASAQASSHATQDQASSHGTAEPPKRGDFELEVTEEPPTEDQFKSILEYLGGSGKAGKLITGAKDEADGLRKLKSNPGSFQSPVVVDWSNARVVVGDNESEILKLVNALPKEEEN